MTAAAPAKPFSFSHERFPWATFFPGIEVKVLRASDATASYTLLARFAPGTILPKHKHFGEVQAYTLEGRWHYLEYDWFAGAGSYVYEPAFSTHTLHVPEDATEPAVVLFIVNNGMALLTDEDEVFMLEDVPTMRERYIETLRDAGLEAPPIPG
jgi:quercetin dioxygenase-like cupin family protein